MLENNFLEDPTVKQDIEKIAATLNPYRSRIAGKVFLITGGSGFLGKYLVGALLYLNKHTLKKPAKIIVVDNYITSSKKGNVLKNKFIRYIDRDVTKSVQINSHIDYIVHAAGIASPIYYKKYPLETIDVAIKGTRNMLELAKEKGVKSFLFFSSSEIYGDPIPSELPTKETYWGNVSSTGPRSLYDESKRLGETLCMVYYNYFQVPIKIVRPFNVFGPGMGSKDYRVVPNFIRCMLQKESLPVHGAGKQTRTFCYISDAVAGFFLTLFIGRPWEVYNVGSNQKEISMNKLAKIFQTISNEKIDIENVEYPTYYPLGEPYRRCPDVSKIKRELKYRPKVGLENGLLRTITWCKQNWEFSSL